MTKIEIWPKEIVGGDAIVDGEAFAYIRMTDPENGLEVVAVFRPEALATILAQIQTMARDHARPN